MSSSLKLLYIHLLKLSAVVFVFVFIFKPLMQERQCLQIKANSGSSIWDGNWILSLLGSRPSKVILQLQGGLGSCCGIQDPWSPCLLPKTGLGSPAPASPCVPGLQGNGALQCDCSLVPLLFSLSGTLLCLPHLIFQGSFLGLFFSKKPSLILLDKMRGVSSVFLRYTPCISHTLLYTFVCWCVSSIQNNTLHVAGAQQITCGTHIWIAPSCSHDVSMCLSPHDSLRAGIVPIHRHVLCAWQRYSEMFEGRTRPGWPVGRAS